MKWKKSRRFEKTRQARRWLMIVTVVAIIVAALAAMAGCAPDQPKVIMPDRVPLVPGEPIPEPPEGIFIKPLWVIGEDKVSNGAIDWAVYFEQARPSWWTTGELVSLYAVPRLGLMEVCTVARFQPAETEDGLEYFERVAVVDYSCTIPVGQEDFDPIPYMGINADDPIRLANPVGSIRQQ